MRSKAVVVVLLVLVASVALASEVNLSALISATYPLAGKCAPINNEVAYRLGVNTPAEVYFASRRGFVAGYLVAGDTIYAVPDGPATEAGQWMRATRAVRCGNPTRCRFFVPTPAPRIIERRVEIKVPVDRIVEVPVDRVVEVPVEKIVEVTKTVYVQTPSCGTPTGRKPAPCPLFGTPVVLAQSQPGGTFILQNQATEGILPTLVGGLLGVWAASAGRSSSNWNIAGGNASVGNITSASQSGSISSSTASATAHQNQGQTTHVVASPNTTIGISTPVNVGQNTAISTPVAVAVN